MSSFFIISPTIDLLSPQPPPTATVAAPPSLQTCMTASASVAACATQAASSRPHAGCRNGRKSVAVPCGLPRQPTRIVVGAADVGRAVCSRPTCIPSAASNKGRINRRMSSLRRGSRGLLRLLLLISEAMARALGLIVADLATLSPIGRRTLTRPDVLI